MCEGNDQAPLTADLTGSQGTCELHRKGEKFTGNKILSGRYGANRSLGRPRIRCEDNIKIDFYR
jgi:hypothetical protein